MLISLPNVPLLAQNDRADCLPACVQMVSIYLGKSVEQVWLRRVLETSDIGTPGFKVLNLQRHGYDVTYAAATDERVLTAALTAGIPPIALVFTTHLPYWQQQTAHAVVVVSFGPAEVSVHDPAFPLSPQIMTRDAFMLA